VHRHGITFDNAVGGSVFGAAAVRERGPSDAPKPYDAGCALPHADTRLTLRVVTVLLPAIIVFGAEVVRHEMLHGMVPEMLGNVLTGATALVVSALILVPVYRRLEAADLQLRTSEIEHAVFAERERLARELHDGISQALFFLNVTAGVLERSLAASDTVAARRAALEIAGAVHDTSRQVREAIFDLRTSLEPDQPLNAWVRTYAQRFGEMHGLACDVTEAGTAVELPLDAALHAAAVVREALHNVVKHAQAGMIEVRMDWSREGVSITIHDDGRGIPDPIPGPAQGRYGLSALEDRAAAAGGTVAVSPSPRGGTMVVFWMPCALDPRR
jgi:signal transduction histidine kinase